MKTATQWKAFYAAERASLGEKGLRERLERAPAVALPPGGALVFPHTRIAITGDFTAAAARAVLETGATEVLALGVLHGGRDADAERVRRARAGDEVERAALRRVHAGTDALCSEEFSLDGFAAMLSMAAAARSVKPPRVVARYPFLVGDDPDLPGADELARLAASMPVVATTDPMHHGAGYGTPPASRRSEDEPSILAWARGAIATQLESLGRKDWAGFARLAAEARSDFRDTGPSLFRLLGSTATPRGEILDLRLVDYADALEVERPTWVAGPLMRVTAG